MFVFNSALKGLDDTQQSKSKPPARWIVVKVSHLNNMFLLIFLYCLYVFPFFLQPNRTYVFFYLLLTYESQPQTCALFPHVNPNLIIHHALEKLKRIKKIIQ